MESSGPVIAPATTATVLRRWGVLGAALIGHQTQHVDWNPARRMIRAAERVTPGERKRLLLFDDLFRSGATVSVIAKLLSGEGGASAVYLPTLTQTRKKL